MNIENTKKLAKKAKNGDSDALGVLILMAPEGAMEGKEPEDYATEMADDGDVEAMKAALEAAGLEADDETAAKVCEAYHASA
jgi:hypothetical protein